MFTCENLYGSEFYSNMTWLFDTGFTYNVKGYFFFIPHPMWLTYIVTPTWTGWWKRFYNYIWKWEVVLRLHGGIKNLNPVLVNRVELYRWEILCWYVNNYRVTRGNQAELIVPVWRPYQYHVNPPYLPVLNLQCTFQMTDRQQIICGHTLNFFITGLKEI